MVKFKRNWPWKRNFNSGYVKPTNPKQISSSGSIKLTTSNNESLGVVAQASGNRFQARAVSLSQPLMEIYF